MALIALTSAKGAPGVTTTALALTLSWYRSALLVDADPVGGGGIIAGFFAGQHDPTQIGLVNLAIAAGHPDVAALTSALPAQTLALSSDGSRRVLPGISDASQVATMLPFWPTLGRALTGLADEGTDVIVDAGRLGTIGTPTQLLQQADMVVLVTRSDLPSLSAAVSRIPFLRQTLGDRDDPGALQLLVVGTGQPYPLREIADIVTVPVLADLEWDAAAATVLTRATPKTALLDTSTPHRYAKSRLARSAARVSARIDQQLTETASVLTPPAGTRS